MWTRQGEKKEAESPERYSSIVDFSHLAELSDKKENTKLCQPLPIELTQSQFPENWMIAEEVTDL